MLPYTFNPKSFSIICRFEKFEVWSTLKQKQHIYFWNNCVFLFFNCGFLFQETLKACGKCDCASAEDEKTTNNRKASIDTATSSKNKTKYSLTHRLSAPVGWTHQTCGKWSSVCTSWFSLCWVSQCIFFCLTLFKSLKWNKINQSRSGGFITKSTVMWKPDESSAHHRSTKINPRIFAHDRGSWPGHKLQVATTWRVETGVIGREISKASVFVQVDRPVGRKCDQMNGL